MLLKTKWLCGKKKMCSKISNHCTWHAIKPTMLLAKLEKRKRELFSLVRQNFGQSCYLELNNLTLNSNLTNSKIYLTPILPKTGGLKQYL